MSSKPTQHFQHEFEADKPSSGFLPDETLFKWFNDAYSTSKHLATLYSIAVGINAKNVLEVGFGRSSIVLAKAVSQTGGKLVCCDQRDFSYAFNEDEKKHVTFVNGYSHQARAMFEPTGIDFAFLDYFSDEKISAEFVLSEVVSTFSLLKKNGIICLHDAMVSKYNVGVALKHLKTGWFGLHNNDLEIASLPYNYGLAIIRRLSDSPFGTLEDVQLKKVE